MADREKLKERRKEMSEALKEKLKEAFQAVFPIALIVLGLSLTLTPLESGTFLLFAIGVLLLIVGTALFNLGADMSMLVIGQRVGSTLTKSKKVWLIAFVSFVIGVIVTMAEPDLQILAEQVPDIDNMVMVVTVSVGMGLFLMDVANCIRRESFRPAGDMLYGGVRVGAHGSSVEFLGNFLRRGRSHDGTRDSAFYHVAGRRRGGGEER